MNASAPAPMTMPIGTAAARQQAKTTARTTIGGIATTPSSFKSPAPKTRAVPTAATTPPFTIAFGRMRMSRSMMKTASNTHPTGTQMAETVVGSRRFGVRLICACRRKSGTVINTRRTKMSAAHSPAARTTAAILKGIFCTNRSRLIPRPRCTATAPPRNAIRFRQMPERSSVHAKGELKKWRLTIAPIVATISARIAATMSASAA